MLCWADWSLEGFKSDGTHGQVFRSAAVSRAVANHLPPINSIQPNHDPFQEFALHAKWLAYGRPKGACECKYCSRTSQKVIAARLKKATEHAEMPKRPGLNASRVSKRKINARASRRAAKRTRLDGVIIQAKDYTRGQSQVSELHKQQLVNGMLSPCVALVAEAALQAARSNSENPN